MALFVNIPDGIRSVIEESMHTIDESYEPMPLIDFNPMLTNSCTQMLIRIAQWQNCKISKEDCKKVALASLMILNTRLEGSKVFSAIFSILPISLSSLPNTGVRKVRKLIAIYYTYELGVNFFNIIKTEYNKAISVDSNFIQMATSVKMPNSQTFRELCNFLN